MVEIKMAKVHEGATIPTKRDCDAGFDLYACFDEDYIEIAPHETKLIPLGIASAFEEGWYVQFAERGSTGTKGMKYGAGIIDAGYRSEWFFCMTNTNKHSVVIAKYPEDWDLDPMVGIVYPYSKAIGQAVVLPVPKTRIVETTLEDIQSIESERGDGKLGSSGK